MYSIKRFFSSLKNWLPKYTKSSYTPSSSLTIIIKFWWSFCSSIFIFKKKCLSLILELLHLFTINAIVRHVEGLLLHTFQTWKLCLGAHTHIWTSQHRFIYMKCWRTLSSQSVFTTLEFLGALNLRPSRTASFDIVGILTYICFIFFETNLLYSMFRKLSTIALKLMSHNKIKNHRSTNHHHW